MDAYKLDNGKIRVPTPIYDKSMLGDGSKDVDYDDPEAQEWIKWYAERGGSIPKLPVTNRNRGSDNVIERPSKLGNFGKSSKFGNFKMPKVGMSEDTPLSVNRRTDAEEIFDLLTNSSMEGEPCGQGQTAAKTGRTPKDHYSYEDLKEDQVVVHPIYGRMEIGFRQQGGKVTAFDKDDKAYQNIDPKDFDKAATEKLREDESKAKEKKSKDKEVNGKKDAEGAPKVEYTGGKALQSVNTSLSSKSLQTMGGSLHVRDPHLPMIAQHLEDLTKVPEKLAQKVKEAGITVHIGKGSIADLDDNSDLKGAVSPKCQGGFRLPNKSASIGCNEDGKTISSASVSVALHEYGHATDHALGLRSDSELSKIHSDQYDKLQPYYQQGGPGSHVGKGEMIAEGFATYHMDPKRCKTEFGDAFVGWLTKKLKEYQ